MNLKEKIREVPNWPIKGVNFKDITTLMEDPETFQYVVDVLASPFLKRKVDKIVGIDARGFLFAAPVAYKLKAGLAIVRKPGKLPYKTIQKKYTLEYASNIIQMHKDTVLPNEKILLIDDLIATGGTAIATCDLIEKLGGKIIGISFVVDLPFLGGSEKLKKRKYSVRSLVSYNSE
ncbi:adenine phosphoribosyltransferase [Patescibacteria group bacterium]|nr:adenine phosphoribosyltransferase [Patescibacteria group bacterium]MBU2472419.1 adenine phosphoribosyltransferase [Patescibacteria group bacterium]